MTSICDHIRAIRKLLPAAAADPEFEMCRTIWWWGFARCFFITRPDDFYAFRSDFVTDLIPEYKAMFGDKFTLMEVCVAQSAQHSSEIV